jgi:hypothetical protein
MRSNAIQRPFVCNSLVSVVLLPAHCIGCRLNLVPPRTRDMLTLSWTWSLFGAAGVGRDCAPAALIRRGRIVGCLAPAQNCRFATANMHCFMLNIE